VSIKGATRISLKITHNEAAFAWISRKMRAAHAFQAGCSFAEKLFGYRRLL